MASTSLDRLVFMQAASFLAKTCTSMQSLIHGLVQVSGPLQQIADAYGTSLVEGVLSHQLKQFVIDGNKCVLNKPTPEHRAEDAEFEQNEVYGIDILVRAPALSCNAAWRHAHMRVLQQKLSLP